MFPSPFLPSCLCVFLPYFPHASVGPPDPPVSSYRVNNKANPSFLPFPSFPPSLYPLYSLSPLSFPRSRPSTHIRSSIPSVSLSFYFSSSLFSLCLFLPSCYYLYSLSPLFFLSLSLQHALYLLSFLPLPFLIFPSHLIPSASSSLSLVPASGHLYSLPSSLLFLLLRSLLSLGSIGSTS